MSLVYDVDPKVIRCPDCNAQVLQAKQRGVDRTDLLETGMIPVMMHTTGTAARPDMARTYHRCGKPRVTVPHRVGTANVPNSQDPQ